MRIIPTKEQWKGWTLPSKCSYIGVPLAILIFIGSFIYTEFIKTDYSQLSFEIEKKLESKNISEKEINELIYRVEKELNQKINKETWDDYAKSILSIYKNVDSNCVIKINEKFFCDQSKQIRTIDLSIHSKIAGHEVLVAVKLLPINEPIDFQIIEYYSQILKEIKVSKGVIICNGGFTEKAINYAKSNFIDLCAIKDAESRLWSNDIAIPVIWKEVIPNLSLSFIISFEANDKVHKDFGKMIFSNNNGKNYFTIPDYFINKWNNNEIPHFTDSIIIIQNDLKNLKARANKNDWRNIKSFSISYFTQVNCYLKYFTPTKYKAIENFTSGKTKLSELELEISSFKNDNSWIKINRADTLFRGVSIILSVENPIMNNIDLKTNQSYMTRIQ